MDWLDTIHNRVLLVLYKRINYDVDREMDPICTIATGMPLCGTAVTLQHKQQAVVKVCAVVNESWFQTN